MANTRQKQTPVRNGYLPKAGPKSKSGGRNRHANQQRPLSSTDLLMEGILKDRRRADAEAKREQYAANDAMVIRKAELIVAEKLTAGSPAHEVATLLLQEYGPARKDTARGLKKIDVAIESVHALLPSGGVYTANAVKKGLDVGSYAIRVACREVFGVRTPQAAPTQETTPVVTDVVEQPVAEPTAEPVSKPAATKRPAKAATKKSTSRSTKAAQAEPTAVTA